MIPLSDKVDYCHTSNCLDSILNQLSSSVSIIKQNIMSKKHEMEVEFQKRINNLVQQHNKLISEVDILGSKKLKLFERQIQSLYIVKSKLEQNGGNTAAIDRLHELITNIISESIVCQNCLAMPSVDDIKNQYGPAASRYTPKGDNFMWLTPQSTCFCPEDFPKGLTNTNTVEYSKTAESFQKRKELLTPRHNDIADSRKQSFSSCYSSGGESFEVLACSPYSERLSDWMKVDKMNPSDIPGSLFASATRGAPSLADTSSWLAGKQNIGESATVTNTSLFPANLFNSSLEFWLQGSHTPIQNSEDDLREKLASLAVQYDADEGKEVDQSEVVAMVCCQKENSGEDCSNTERKPLCKSFSECRSRTNQCVSHLVEAASACDPNASAWLWRQDGLIPTTLPQLDKEQEQTTPDYLLQLRKIGKSDLAQWTTSMQENKHESDIPPYLAKLRDISSSASSYWLAENIGVGKPFTSVTSTCGKRQWLSSTREEDVEEEKVDTLSTIGTFDSITLAKDDEEQMDVEVKTDLSSKKKSKIANLLLSDAISPEAMLEMLPPHPYNHSSLLYQSQYSTKRNR